MKLLRKTKDFITPTAIWNEQVPKIHLPSLQRFISSPAKQAKNTNYRNIEIIEIIEIVSYLNP